MKNGGSRTQRRKGVEIYFILYLAAVVIILSNKGTPIGNEGHNDKYNAGIDFAIKAEKPLLVCRVSQAADGTKSIETDSVNTIWDIGDVSYVSYDFVIEDVEFGNKLRLNANKGNNFFSFVVDNENHTTTFNWHPSLETNEDKNYIVHVTATANMKREKDSVVVSAKTQFALVVTHIYDYDVSPSNIDVSSNSNSDITGNKNSISLMDFSIKAADNNIRAIANQEWENEIFCLGINTTTQLKNIPEVRITNTPENNGCVVYPISMNGNSIIVKGKAPSVGSSRVVVTVRRRNDLMEASTSFTIRPISYGEPEYPRTIYPMIDYEINPNLSNELRNVSVFIKDNNEVLASVYRNTSFKFSVNNSDIGKTLTLERYSNNQLIGRKYYIKVADYPIPEIVRITKNEKNEVVAEVQTFGIISSGKNNSCKELQITGNAKANQKYGKTRANKEERTTYEQFTITIIDKNKPFTFEITAIDQLGRKSQTQSYKE